MDRPAISGDVVVAGPDLVPDAFPYDGPGPTGSSTAVNDLPHDDEGRIGTCLGNLSWRSRMRWLDDGGR